MVEKEDKIGKDLKLKFDELGADITITPNGDLVTVAREDNLVQAIIARLSTDQGELYDIGQADYGSRLHEIVGEINNNATRQRIKALVRECLAQEPRIVEVTNVNVLTTPNDPHRVNIEITVLSIESNVYLTMTYPFRLEV